MNVEEPILFDDLIDFDEEDFLEVKDEEDDNDEGGSNPPSPDPSIFEEDDVTVMKDKDDSEEEDDDTPPTPTVTYEDEEDDDTPPAADEQVKAYYDFLKEYGAIAVPEEFEFDGTPEGLKAALEETEKTRTQQVAQSLWQQLPEDFKPLLSYALNGGQNLDSYLKAYASENLDDVDVEDPVVQRQLVERYYKETSNHPQDRIDRMIQKLEDRDQLYEEALDSLEDLKRLQEERKANLVEQARIEEENRAKLAQERVNAINSAIDTAEYLDETRKRRIKSFGITPIRQGDRTTTQFDEVLNSAFSNPEHLVQLMDIAAEYSPEKGFNFERLSRKLKTENSRAFNKLLDETLSKKPRGRNSQQPIKEDFN